MSDGSTDTRAARRRGDRRPPARRLARSAPRTRRRRPTWWGVRTVAVARLRAQRRTLRWPVALGVWLLTVYGVVWLAWSALGSTGEDGAGRGVVVHGMTTSTVLVVGLLAAPVLTATALNGDRPTVTALRVTRLTAADIVLGTLLSAWAVIGVFLATAVPAYVLAVVAGVNPLAALAALAVLAACLAAVCAIGLGLSALTRRTVTSFALTYLVVLALTVGTVVLFGLLLPQTVQEDDVRVYRDDPSGRTCSVVDTRGQQTHTERIWWVLAANPFVVTADAAPAAAPDPGSPVFDPLQAVSTSVRLARLGPSEDIEDLCTPTDGADPLREGEIPPDEVRAAEGRPVWPIGLTMLGLLGGIAVAVAIRRVDAPADRRRPRTASDS